MTPPRTGSDRVSPKIRWAGPLFATFAGAAIVVMGVAVLRASPSSPMLESVLRFLGGGVTIVNTSDNASCTGHWWAPFAELLAQPAGLAMVALGASGVLLLSSYLRRGPKSHAAASAERSTEAAFAASRRCFDDEIKQILHILESQLESHQKYCGALTLANRNLGAMSRPEQIRAAIEMLLRQNEMLTTSMHDMEERLNRSKARVQELAANLVEEREQGLRDPLTSLYGRRHFDEALANEVVSAQKGNAQLALALLDLDDFKSVNDTYGHPIGDEILKSFAKLLLNCVKGAELTARYGGEEFAIISPGASMAEAMRLANSIQDRLSAKQWLLKDGRRIRNVTASIGIAQLIDGETAESILKRADENLYKSKMAGKNRTTIDNQQMTSS